jgi:uncharacterized protein YbaR (Trm112 family)
MPVKSSLQKVRGAHGELLEILVCPQTGGRLQYDSKNNRLISPSAGCAYPIRDGVPVMLAEESEPWQKGKK